MNERIVSLLYRHSKGELLNEEERNELEEWVAQSKHNWTLYNELSNQEELQRDLKKMLSYNTEAIWNKYERLLHPEKKTPVHLFNQRFLRYAAVGATLILLSLTTYFLVTRKSESHQPLTTDQSPAIHDIPPGTDGAVLTLSDGRQIDLNSAGKGEIAKQGSMSVVKSADGEITYQSSGDQQNGKIEYNTVNTLRGQKCRITLPDKSKVWLNAGSSIVYPIAFTGKERVVTITGELYFEVQKDPSRPFKVNTRGQTVEVLGTHFNINAYEDEASINTTLLEGLVKVSKGGNNSFLQPGQQAMVSDDKNGNTGIKLVKDIDVEQVVAWKEGIFSFKKADIETIMRQVSRWYGVEVVFKDKIDGHFVATLPRSVTVSKLLQQFEKMGGVHFDIDDANKKITVRH